MLNLLVPPKWTPKNKATPLKEEFIKFHQEVTRYHNRIKGALINGHTGFHKRLPEIPTPPDDYTDKSAIVVAAANDMTFLVDIVRLYEEAQRSHSERTPSMPSTASGSAAVDRSRSVKVALPDRFNRSASKALTFLTECNTYFTLNQSQFHDHQLHIRWALQLCTDKTATWKRIQLQIMDEEDNIPDHLMSWKLFQQNFRLKWADLHAKQKAQNKLANVVQQTGSVRRYVKQFEELVLEAGWRDETILVPMFYNSLKFKIKQFMIGR
jgi:hypothetical protein